MKIATTSKSQALFGTSSSFKQIVNHDRATDSFAIESGSTVVTISNAAKKMEASLVNSFPTYVRNISESLHNDPSSSNTLATVKNFASIRDGALVALGPNSDGVKDVYYTSTGLPVTEESKSYFASMSEKVLSERTNIYNSEVAKGTPAPDIFDKLQNYMKSLPENYLNMMNWRGLGNAA